MNYLHRVLCRSALWERTSAKKIVPWALAGLDLGDAALEIGPGYGANVYALGDRAASLTGVEIDPELAAGLRAKHAGRLRVVEGDGAAIPLPENTFSSVVCFTMLHHVPSPSRQDELFAEALRVLRPGGVFAGSDGLDQLPFRLMHVGDTCVPVPPETITDRLTRAGFTEIEVDKRLSSFRFRARRPVK